MISLLDASLPNDSPLWTRAALEALFSVELTGMRDVLSVKIDSRLIQPGDLFVALQGPRQTGVQFVQDALQRGAVAVLVPQNVAQDCIPPFQYQRRICVPDTLVALQQLAAAGRARTRAKILGITGSFGKTSLKEALRLVLSEQGQVTASERSFNNHWGVPLTLSLLKTDDDYGLIEMGMNHAGEIAPLAQMARPHVALITNVRRMHLETLGSLEAIAQEKSSVFAGMLPGGVAVLNADDEMFSMISGRAQARGLDIITFGQTPSAMWRLKAVESRADVLRLKIEHQQQTFDLTLEGLGIHWAWNILALLAITTALGLEKEKILESFKAYRLPEGRGTRYYWPWPGGEIMVIDESYNAGPDSMRAALKTLSQINRKGQGRRIAILGDMRELGSAAADEHRALSKVLEENQIDLVFTCGVWMENLFNVLPHALRGGHGEDVSDLIPAVLKVLQAGDVVMSKGSKGQYAERGRMYGFVEAIQRQSQQSEAERSLSLLKKNKER